jgi:hypothetical protein
MATASDLPEQPHQSCSARRRHRQACSDVRDWRLDFAYEGLSKRSLRQAAQGSSPVIYKDLVIVAHAVPIGIS